jgi:desulfoferrodoxin (superoxide reductase-like protein)
VQFETPYIDIHGDPVCSKVFEITEQDWNNIRPCHLEDVASYVFCNIHGWKEYIPSYVSCNIHGWKE